MHICLVVIFIHKIEVNPDVICDRVIIHVAADKQATQK